MKTDPIVIVWLPKLLQYERDKLVEFDPNSVWFDGVPPRICFGYHLWFLYPLWV